MRQCALLTTVALLMVTGCASAPSRPAQADIDHAQTIIATINPGDPVEKVTDAFPHVYRELPKFIEMVGIIDDTSLQTADAVTRTLWIGYYYFAGNVGYYPIVEQRRMCSFTIVNGRVDSIYKP